MPDTGRTMKLAEERSWGLLKEAEAMGQPADAMLFLTTTAIPLLITGFKLAAASGGKSLGSQWLERTLMGVAAILEKETGDQFRLTIQRVERPQK